MQKIPIKKKYIKQIAVLVLSLIFYFYSGATLKRAPQTEKNVSAGVSINPTKPAHEQIASSSALYTVVRVVDGDTFSIMVDGKKETVRLIGIDTPEVVDPRKPVQCFGKEASEKAKELLTGKTVILQTDPTQGDTDKYKRLLRYAFLPDGTHVNEYMIREGYAHEYTYQSNPYTYQEKFKSAEVFAREQRKGLWARGVCD